MSKTDNGNLPAKLALRRHFLAKYHADGSARVLDCCQGDGVVWTALRKEFSVASYWGLDQKVKRGRMSIDSALVLGHPGWGQNVIDIDTYGSPWKHWLAMLPNMPHSLTVFLTIGRRGIANGNLSPKELANEEREVLGMPHGFFSVCGKRASTLLGSRLGDLAANMSLARALDYATVAEAVEALGKTATRYVGIRLEKLTQPLEPEPVATYNAGKRKGKPVGKHRLADHTQPE